MQLLTFLFSIFYTIPQIFDKIENLFQCKNPCCPKSMLFAKFWALGNKIWIELTLILGGKVENLEFEKGNHLLNLLLFQILYQKVLTRVVGHFWNIKFSDSLTNTGMVGFFISIRC